MIRFFLCICKSVMENHYNLLYREDERELIPICKQMNVSLMPYSPLAAGHLARPTWKSESLRGRTDRVAVGKYDRMEDADMKIVTRVHELAEKYQCKMSQIAIAWQWAKGVTSPIIGATKMQYLDDAAGALNVRLTAEGIAYLEECYVPHPIVGAIDKNPAKQGKVMATGHRVFSPEEAEASSDPKARRTPFTLPLEERITALPATFKSVRS